MNANVKYSPAQLTIITEGEKEVMRITVPAQIVELLKSYLPMDDEYISCNRAREILQDKGYLCKTNETLYKWCDLYKVPKKRVGKFWNFQTEKVKMIPNK